MKNRNAFFGHIVFVLGILAALGIVYNMAAIQVFKDLVFLDHDVSMPFEILILMATLIILLFDIASIGWVSHKIYVMKKSMSLDTLALIWGAVCLFSLMGAKVMADEIAREFRLGWEILGEWIILYGCFFIQLFYIILIFIHLNQNRRQRQKT